MAVVGGLSLWSGRLREAQGAARTVARRLADESEGPLSASWRLAASGAAWRGAFADHLSYLIQVLERQHFDPLAGYLYRLSDALERLADETDHAAKLELINLPLPCGFDLFAGLASLRALAHNSPQSLSRSWLDGQTVPSGSYVSIDTDRARDLSRLLREAGEDLLDSYRRLRSALAELDLEAPPALAGVAHAAEDLGLDVLHRVEAYEEADRRAASGFGSLMDSARSAVSGAALAASRSSSRVSRAAAKAARERWQGAALSRAGIDLKAWKPKKGIEHNKATIEKAYSYYGDLYQQHPELEWLGLAAIAGPFFYAGWQDLDAVRKVVDPGKRARMISELLGLPKLPEAVYEAGGAVLDPLGTLLSGMSAKELEWFIDLFLDMQKQIFMDLAWQHEAFVAGGIAEMRRQAAARNIDGRTLRAWENIATGDPERISRGTAGLIEREQRRVIQNEYDKMRDHHGPVGEAFTLAVTWMADNPIPGGQSYKDFSHHKVGVDLPAPGVDLPRVGPFDLPKIGVDLPDLSIEIPKGNVADIEDRMRWITDDVVPAYEDFIHEHPNKVDRLLDSPVSERADAFRKFGG